MNTQFVDSEKVREMHTLLLWVLSLVIPGPSRLGWVRLTCTLHAQVLNSFLNHKSTPFHRRCDIHALYAWAHFPNHKFAVCHIGCARAPVSIEPLSIVNTCCVKVCENYAHAVNMSMCPISDFLVHTLHRRCVIVSCIIQLWLIVQTMNTHLITRSVPTRDCALLVI